MLNTLWISLVAVVSSLVVTSPISAEEAHDRGLSISFCGASTLVFNDRFQVEMPEPPFSMKTMPSSFMSDAGLVSYEQSDVMAVDIQGNLWFFSEFFISTPGVGVCIDAFLQQLVESDEDFYIELLDLQYGEGADYARVELRQTYQPDGSTCDCLLRLYHPTDQAAYIQAVYYDVGESYPPFWDQFVHSLIVQ